MSYVIDIIIIAILALCVFLGYKRGLTKSAIKILSFVLSIVIAFILFKPISNVIINKTQIDDNIKKAVVQVVQDDINEEGKVEEDSNLPQSMVNYINKQITKSVEETKQTAVNTAAEQISKLAVNAMVLILVFVVARIILIFVNILSELLTSLPVIKQVDKTGGIIYGLLEAFIIISFIFAIISLISPMIEKTSLVTMINKSILGSALYNNNIILKLIFRA